MTLVAVAVTSLTLSTVTSNFGDNGTCSAGTKGILQFLNFHTFRSSLVTLTLSFGWNNVWEIFQGCVSISDTTDAFIYLIWIATVVTFAPKMITAIVVSNFEASATERREFVISRQYYLEQLHLQELKVTRATRILLLKDIGSLEAMLLEDISTALMRLKVSVLNKQGGFPSHDIRQLHILLTTNMLDVRLVMLKASLDALHDDLMLEKNILMRQLYNDLKNDMIQHLSWCALRPDDQLEFVLLLLEIFSSILMIEATSPARSVHLKLTGSGHKKLAIVGSNVRSSSTTSDIDRRSSSFGKMFQLNSLVKVMREKNDMPGVLRSRAVTESEESTNGGTGGAKEMWHRSESRKMGMALRSMTLGSTARKGATTSNDFAHSQRSAAADASVRSGCLLRVVDFILCVSCFPRDKQRSCRMKAFTFLRSSVSKKLTSSLLVLSFVMAAIPSTLIADLDLWFVVELVFVTIFFIENLCRWIFQWNGQSDDSILLYLFFDLFVVAGMIGCFFVVVAAGNDDELKMTWISIGRALRAVRTLRLAGHSARMNAVVRAMLSQRTAIFNVFAVLTLTLFVYSIVGGFLFAHDFQIQRNSTAEWCTHVSELGWGTSADIAIFNSTARSTATSIANIRSNISSVASTCDLRLVDELQVIPGFSNIHHSFMTLIQAATLDNLTMLTMRLISIHEVGAVFYIMSFVMIVPFFLSNLFIAIFAMTVSSTPGKNSLLSRQQNRDVTSIKDTYGASPVVGRRRAPSNCIRRAAFVAVCEPDGSFKIWFQMSITVILMIDMLGALSLPHSTASAGFVARGGGGGSGGSSSSGSTSSENMVDVMRIVLRFVFMGVYIFEVSLKLIALGPSVYLLSSKYNAVDTGLIALCVVLWLFSLFGWIDSNDPVYTSLLKVRYFRLVTHFVSLGGWLSNQIASQSSRAGTTLKMIKDVVSSSMYAVGNIIELWFLVTIVWAVIGVSMFARWPPSSSLSSLSSPASPSSPSSLQERAVAAAQEQTKINEGYSTITYGINDNTNFDSFPQAFLALVRIGMIDHWSELYRSCTRANPDTSFLTSIYFVFYIILISTFIKSMGVAVIYSQFVRLTMVNESSMMVSDSDKESFQAAWLKYDPTGRGYIPLSNVIHFLFDLRKNELAARNANGNKLKSNPRLKLIQSLKRNHQLSEKKLAEAEAMRRFTHRLLVPIAADRWTNRIIQELKPFARNTKCSVEIHGDDGDENTTQANGTSSTCCFGCSGDVNDRDRRKKECVTSAVSFSRVLMLLVQKRLHEQAGQLSRHFEKDNVPLNNEARIEMTRCPMCKLYERAMVELAEMMARVEMDEEEKEGGDNDTTTFEAEKKQTLHL